MKRVTVRDVAEAAGVSATTVSHALNGKGRVEAATRQRVEDAARRLGYRPNLQARALRVGRGHTIALVSSISSGDTGLESQLAYQTQMALAGSQAALGAGYALVLVPPMEQEQWVDTLPVDGMIVVHPSADDELLARLRRRRVPVVTVGHDLSAPVRRTGWVSTDAHRTVELAMGHLLERGARHPAVAIGREHRSFEVEVAGAYRRWAEDQGVEPIVVEVSSHDGRRAAIDKGRELLRAHPEVDGLFAPLDATAAGLAEAVVAEGRSVPDDVRVVGTDGWWSQRHTPALTVVDIRPGDQAVAAVRSLIRQLSSGRAQPAVTLEPRLVVRSST